MTHNISVMSDEDESSSGEGLFSAGFGPQTFNFEELSSAITQTETTRPSRYQAVLNLAFSPLVCSNLKTPTVFTLAHPHTA